MLIIKLSAVLLCLGLAAGSLDVRTGWLDRLVQFYKKVFLRDLVQVAPVKIQVSIIKATPGYIDSPNWDYESVVRLIGLIRESETASPVRRALRDLLEPPPSRRYMGLGSLHKARKLAARRMKRCAGDPTRRGYPKYCRRFYKSARKFVAEMKRGVNREYIPVYPNPNDLYYDDMISVEDPDAREVRLWNETRHRNRTEPREEDVVYITNPVEAKLPSGKITVGLLRRILQARAEAARVMPTTTTPPWNISTTTTDNGTSASGNQSTTVLSTT